jgi:hypothetical protein
MFEFFDKVVEFGGKAIPAVFGGIVDAFFGGDDDAKGSSKGFAGTAYAQAYAQSEKTKADYKKFQFAVKQGSSRYSDPKESRKRTPVNLHAGLAKAAYQHAQAFDTTYRKITEQKKRAGVA